MMTGVPEEMTTEVEGEAWMMDHVVARTPNPGSLWGDLVCTMSDLVVRLNVGVFTQALQSSLNYFFDDLFLRPIIVTFR